jgi:DTW domain-containing protein YfiP
MGTQNKAAGSLYTFVDNNAILDDLRSQIKQLDEDLTTINVNIALCEQYKDEDAAEYLASAYNTKNLKRIQLALKANAVEQEILLFELERALAD